MDHRSQGSKRIVNFDKDLSDGLVFSSLILSHVPTLKRLTSMYQFCTEKEHFQHNASNIIGAISDLGLEYNITVKDILEPNPCGKYSILNSYPQHICRYVITLYIFIPQSSTVYSEVNY
jgi:hypothetical protein